MSWDSLRLITSSLLGREYYFFARVQPGFLFLNLSAELADGPITLQGPLPGCAPANSFSNA